MIHLPHLTLTELVDDDLFRILDAHLQYLVLSIALQETDLVTLFYRAREDSYQSHDTSEVIVAAS